jgi:transcriptional regulator with GAF, ATPase, and Fis domain
MKTNGPKKTKLRRRKTSATKRRRAAPTSNLQKQLDQRTHELAEARKQVAEAQEQQTAASEVLRVISTSPSDEQPVYRTIVRNAVSLCGSLFALVFRFDGKFLHFAAGHSAAPGYVELLKTKYPMRPDNSQVAGRAVLTKSVVRLKDALADPHYDRRFPLSGGWRRMLGVPMLREGILLGVIVVGWEQPGPVPKTQEELLKTFADQAVIAIENVRLFEAEQQRTHELSEALEQQTATSEVLKVISSSPGELQPVFKAMLGNAVRICEASYGVLFRFENGAARAAAMLGVPPAFAEFWEREPRRPGPRTALGRVAETRQTVHIVDVTHEPAYVEGEPVYVAPPISGASALFSTSRCSGTTS